MKSDLSKKEAQQEIETFFLNPKDKSSKEIKKIKRLAANKKISLKTERKKFCKYCFNPFSGKENVRIKNKVKSVECLNCKKVSRWRME
ncbi:Uncharacterised protein [uncultured archaeon]|nr:Uncharacterised protein [uncultured archaeon]